MLERQYANTGVLPKPLEDRPTLTNSTLLYYEVFMDLSSSRQAGEIPSPIPFSEVMGYCSELGILERDIRFSYWRIIHACDDEVLKDYAAEAKKRAEAMKNK